jgi:hypothetical protein
MRKDQIMSKDLFFLPLIANALQKPDPKKGLQEAFEQIERLGRQPEYKQGFRQFQIFMKEIKGNIEARSNISEDIALNALLRDLELQVIAGVLEENRNEEQACLDLIKSRPGWEKQFERLCSGAEKAKAPEGATKIIIDKDGEYFETIRFNRPPSAKTLRNIKPGLYGFRLETGRVLGKEELTRNNLLWVYAYPTQDLKLAADTGDTEERPAREIRLLGGELIIQVFPGLESGRLKVIIRGQDDSD